MTRRKRGEGFEKFTGDMDPPVRRTSESEEMGFGEKVFTKMPLLENPHKPTTASVLADVEKAYSISRDSRVNRSLERAIEGLKTLV